MIIVDCKYMYVEVDKSYDKLRGFYNEDVIATIVSNQVETIFLSYRNIQLSQTYKLQLR